jgi:hypothetical protein
MDEIRNKVKASSLIQLDLADFKPSEEIVIIDIKDQLWQGLALKEKDFRTYVKNENWTSFSGKVVGVTCSAEAIIPTWAYMLIIAQLSELNIIAFVGDKKTVELELIKRNIAALETSKMLEGKFIIKGCSDITDPAFAMSELTKKLIPVASSIMYGEPCSTVPVFKKKRKT